MGTLCESDGVAIANYLRIHDGGTWTMAAHELGHLFGAQHSFEDGPGLTGGIMDYGNGKFESIFQFHPFRKSEVCSTLAHKMQDFPECFSVLENGKRWRKSGRFGPCFPSIGEFRFRSVIYECEIYENGLRRNSSPSECETYTRPYGELEMCTEIKVERQCNNTIFEYGEECEPIIDGECCNSECKWDSPACDRHIDAAFTVDNGSLFLISRELIYRYSNGHESGLDEGFPQNLSNYFPRNISEFGTIGGAAYLNSTLYLFSSRRNIPEIKVMTIDLSSNTTMNVRQLTVKQLTLGDHWRTAVWFDDIHPSHPESESSDLFRKCGGIDAALALHDQMYLFCDSFYGIFTSDLNLTRLRPIMDLNISYPFITAAYYDLVSRSVKFFHGGEFQNWASLCEIGPPQKTPPLNHLVSSLTTNLPSAPTSNIEKTSTPTSSPSMLVTDIDVFYLIVFTFIWARKCNPIGFHLAEIRFFDVDGSQITNIEIVSSTGENAQYVIDNTFDTAWVDHSLANCAGNRAAITFSMKEIPFEYDFVSAKDHSESDPILWKISFNLLIWTEFEIFFPSERMQISDRYLFQANLQSITNSPTNSPTFQMPAEISVDITFKKTRVCNGIGMQIGDIWFYNKTMSPIGINGITVLRTLGSPPEKEPYNAIDGNINSKWVDRTLAHCRYSLNITVLLEEYPHAISYQTADDAIECDPKEFSISIFDKTWAFDQNLRLDRNTETERLILT